MDDTESTFATYPRIQLVGRVAVELAGSVVDERLLLGRQARLAFALLVIERDRSVSREELAQELWPQGLPRTWSSALRGVVSKVRGFVSAAGLRDQVAPYGVMGAYQLPLPDGVVVDIESACMAVEIAEQALCEGEITRAIALAEHARKIAVRPFLPDTRSRWASGIRDRLGTVALSASCVLGDGYARQGRYQHAVRAAEDAIAREPFRERTHQLLMRVHAAAGNPAQALRAYERCRRLLADELGVYPTDETSALYLALLRNEHDLAQS